MLCNMEDVDTLALYMLYLHLQFIVGIQFIWWSGKFNSPQRCQAHSQWWRRVAATWCQTGPCIWKPHWIRRWTHWSTVDQNTYNTVGLICQSCVGTCAHLSTEVMVWKDTHVIFENSTAYDKYGGQLSLSKRQNLRKKANCQIYV